jgi:nucleoside-diphosphate-sugar epimerase
MRPLIYLVGGNGFVGSAYARLFKKLGAPFQVITRDNAADFYGTRCDVLLNANGNSKKFLADNSPLEEFDASVRSVAETIERFKPEYCIHLSTGDVYPETSPNTTDEEQHLDPSRMSRYGLHKYLAETLVRGTQKNWLIVRMGGFVGAGLKKNAIFDMLTGNAVWLSPSSRLQFINTDKAASIIWSIASRRPSNQVLNLGGSGTVRLADIHSWCRSTSQFKPDAKLVNYELSTERLAKLYGGSLPSSEEEVMSFVNSAMDAQ